MPHTAVRPVPRYYHSTELETDVRSVAGYRGSCPCGWRGKIRSTHAAARVDAHLHRREQHPNPQ